MNAERGNEICNWGTVFSTIYWLLKHSLFGCFNWFNHFKMIKTKRHFKQCLCLNINGHQIHVFTALGMVGDFSKIVRWTDQNETFTKDCNAKSDFLLGINACLKHYQALIISFFTLINTWKDHNKLFIFTSTTSIENEFTYPIELKLDKDKIR